MDVATLRMTKAPLWTGATAVYPYSAPLERKFTVESRFEEVVTLHRREGNLLHLPRAVCPVGKDDFRILGRPVKFSSAFKPRPGQKEFRDKCAALLAAGESFVAEAPTGSGKTVVACDLIARVGRQTLVVVPKEDLMQRWADEIKAVLGIPESQIGIVRGDKYSIGPVTLGMLQSLCKPGRYPEEFPAQFGFVIWDEVHRVPANTFLYTAGLFPARLRLGLSATPSRKDGKDIAVAAHIGPIAVRSQQKILRPKVAIYTTPWRCPRWRHKACKGAGCSRCQYTGWVKARHSAGRAGHILTSMARDRKRNALVVHLAAAMVKAGRNTVLFSDRVEQLEIIRTLMGEKGVPASDCPLYISGIGKKAREAASVRPLILATYGMMGEGTDIPWLDACILATPRSEIVQPVGRVLREHPGKKQPVVIDFADMDSPVYRRFVLNRKTQYRAMGADMQPTGRR